MLSRLIYIASGICYKYLQSRLDLKQSIKFNQPIAVPTDDDISMRYICFGGYEQNIITYLLKNLPKDFQHGSFIDAGAHIGTYSVAFAESFKTVLAFEPNRTIFTFLDLNTKTHKNITVYNEALGETKSIALLNEEKNNSGKSHLTTKANEFSYEVKVKTLDDFKNKLKALKYIKIDVEGHEKQILNGGKNIIMHHKPWILIEVLEDQIFSGTSETLEMLAGLGYKKFYSVESPPPVHRFFSKNKILRSLGLVTHTFKILIFGTPSTNSFEIKLGEMKKRNYEAILCKC